MNVGDYVRTREYIRKIRKIEGDYIYCDIGVFTENEIIKSNPQIIDLIEENDYIRIITDTDYRKVYSSYGKLVIYREEEIPIETFSNKFIGGIITYEQMESMQYRVEE